MRKIIENTSGYPLKSKGILQSNNFNAFLVSKVKEKGSESLTFLEHGNICGPIQPPTGPFRYFMVLINASTGWSHKIHLDNAGEFTSHAFNEYCMFIGIDIEHPVTHVQHKMDLQNHFLNF
ncbi:hypothetical protein CR513_57993, partial [Mucuna pruriens]